MQIIINLTEDEQAAFEFRLFEYHGIEINFRQLLYKEYPNDLYERLINTLTEKYTVLQELLYEILFKYGYKVKVKSYEFFLDNGVLTIYT